MEASRRRLKVNVKTSFNLQSHIFMIIIVVASCVKVAFADKLCTLSLLVSLYLHLNIIVCKVSCMVSCINQKIFVSEIKFSSFLLSSSSFNIPASSVNQKSFFLDSLLLFLQRILQVFGLKLIIIFDKS